MLYCHMDSFIASFLQFLKVSVLSFNIKGGTPIIGLMHPKDFRQPKSITCTTRICDWFYAARNSAACPTRICVHLTSVHRAYQRLFVWNPCPAEQTHDEAYPRHQTIKQIDSRPRTFFLRYHLISFSSPTQCCFST